LQIVFVEVVRGALALLLENLGAFPTPMFDTTIRER
jgi:hypothetical protein